MLRNLFALVAVLATVTAVASAAEPTTLPKELLEFSAKLNPKDGFLGLGETKITPVGELTAAPDSRFKEPPASFKDKAVVIVSSNSLGAYSAVDPSKVDVFAVKDGVATHLPKLSKTEYANEAGQPLYLFVGPGFDWNKAPYGPGCVFVIMKK